MKNKGFSLVELIIVIAIMAILAAAIAPALIRYIDKSRNAALANEDAYSDIATKMDGTTSVWTAGANSAGPTSNTFEQEVTSNLGGSAPKVKYTKDNNTQWTVYVQQNGKGIVMKGSVELQPEIDKNYK